MCTPLMSFEDLAGLQYLEKMLEDPRLCQGGGQDCYGKGKRDSGGLRHWYS